MGKTYFKALTIAGSDSGGGAGIQADLKTFSALGCFGMSALTAITAQNTLGVNGMHPLPPACVSDQIDAIFEDMGVDAVKIGMLDRVEIIDVVADRLRVYRPKSIVLDPVMVAKSGHRLLKPDAVEALKALLVPLATVLTPNIPEAEDLLGYCLLDNPEGFKSAAIELCRLGPAVVLKGGHSENPFQSDDCLSFWTERGIQSIWLKAKRVNTKNTHGTGCTLSSAIAAFLARGEALELAVQKAKTYLTEALNAGATMSLGKGKGPVHHYYHLWKEGPFGNGGP